MHPLGQLIKDRMDHPDNRWSLQDVVDRMVAAGHKAITSRSRIGQIRNDPIESINRDVIFALADGIGVTPLTVASKAIQSMGVELHPAEVTDAIVTIQIDPTLSDDNRRELAALIQAMRTGRQLRQQQQSQARVDALTDERERAFTGAVADAVVNEELAQLDLNPGDDNPQQVFGP